MAMSPTQKDTVTLTWRVIALLLIAIGQPILITQLRDIKHEIREATDFRIEQRVKNKLYDDHIKWTAEAYKTLDMDLRKLSERHYFLESRVNRP